MAKDKDRALNPAAAQRKADKAKALKKAKGEKQTQRNEKLARRNPDRIQRQIDDLKALESSGEINPREKAILADLERDLKAIRKARETLGDNAPIKSGRERSQQDRGRRDGDRDGNANHTILGKRRHDGERKRYDEPSSGDETDESVRNIPMPRDTPPPMPRSRIPYNTNHHNQDQNQSQNNTSNPNMIAVPGQNLPHALPPRPTPVIEAKTTYSSAPQIRDLKKEAVSRFVPTAVKRKQDAIQGVGGLLEPEELDRLEQVGYIKGQRSQENPASPEITNEGRRTNVEEEDGDEARTLAEEEARFAKELGLDGNEEGNGNGNGYTGDMNVDEREEEGDHLSTRSVKQKSPLQSIPSKPSGLFSSLPKPSTVSSSRHVEIEEVEDEDL